MNENANLLRTLMQTANLTRAETANLLHISIPTIDAWLRPSTSKASNPTPLWAVELLAYKTRQKVPTSTRQDA